MNIEEVRICCLSQPLATEDFPFDDVTLVFRVMGKIFALLSLYDSRWFAVKCQPDYALELRERYPEIRPAYHMNKRHWNQIDLSGDLSNDFIAELIAHSYAEVVKKLPKRARLKLSDHKEENQDACS